MFLTKDKRLHVILLSTLLWIFYLTEGISKTTSFLAYDYFNLAIFFKGTTVFFILLFIILKKIKDIFLVLIVFASFLIGCFFLEQQTNFKVFYNVFKYLFPLLFFIYINNNKYSLKDSKIILKSFEFLLVLNSVLILFGFVCHIDLFKTYKGTRFGYNGLLITSATSTYVYFIALIYFILNYGSKLKKNWKFYLILVSCVLIGTKSLFLIILIIPLYFFISKRIKFNVITILTTFVTLLVLGYFMFIEQEVFKQIYQNDGLLTTIFSYRNDILNDKMMPFILEHWNIMNYLFGGLNDMSLRPQMAFFDIFFMFGFLGGVTYLYAYYKLLFSFKLNFQIITFFSLFLSLVFISGNFFLNASVVIYVTVLKVFLNNYNPKIDI